MTASITALKEAKKQLRNANRKFKSWSAQPTFGSEGEYTSNSLKAGVDAILIDLSALSKSDAKIIKITTHQERTNLTNLTTKLAQLLPSENGAQIAAHLDALKVSLRPYNLRFTAERSEEFFNNCDELQRRATELSVKTTEIEASLESAQSIIEESKKANDDLSSRVSELEILISEIPTKLSAISESEEAADSHLESISALQTSAKQALSQIKETQTLIDNFVNKISQREIQLEEQSKKSESFQQRLSDYQAQHEKLLKKAEGLIESSRQALGYATAEGLSAAFQEHHTLTREDWAAKGWVVSSGVFLLLAIGIGIWVASGAEQATSLPLIIGRLTLIPLCVAGSWFSASQFIKLKNLAEDYAYKSVLAKSLVGFSEQIRQSGEDPACHMTYLQQVLNEIHKDPLRQRNQKSDKDKLDINSIKEAMDQLSAIGKELKELAPKLTGSFGQKAPE